MGRQSKPVFNGFSKAGLKTTISQGALMAKNFLRDQAGNFSMIFALSAVPIMGAAGMGIEFTRYSMIRENLVHSLDASGLAIQRRADELGYDANALTDAQKVELQAYGEDFFYANFKFADDIKNFDVNFFITATNITPTATGKLDAVMLSLLDVDSFDMRTSTQITLRGAGKLELALVLDVTGSMDSDAQPGDGSNDTRMDVLKVSVKNMLNSLYGVNDDATNENVRVGIVPFNTIVNTGGHDVMEDDWLDLDAESYWHGHAFFHVEDPTDIDLTQKVNLFKLYDSIGNETSWKGCVEARPYPLDEFMTPPTDIDLAVSFINTYDDVPSGVTIDPSVQSIVIDAFDDAPDLPYPAATVAQHENTRFVPFFYPDQPDCDSSGCDYYYNSNSPGYVFDKPGNGGDSEWQYENRKFVKDRQYTHQYYGVSGARHDYYQVACQFRYNGSALDGDDPIRDTGGCGDNFTLVIDDAWETLIDRYHVDVTRTQQEEYKIRQAYPGIYNPTTEKYEGKYDLTVSISESNEKAGQGPNRDCSTPLLPLSTSKATVVETIDALDPGGATNTASGTIWGWRLLTPYAPFPEAVDTNIDSDWRKAIIIMTDGQNNVGGRGSTHNGSDFEFTGFLKENRLNENGSESRYEEELNDKTVRMCLRMREQGIRVYTVGFSISSGSGADDMLKACASVPVATESDDATYFLASDGEELIDAFEAITEDLVLLHISG
jgi:Flp pilus assembly protein TadG